MKFSDLPHHSRRSPVEVMRCYSLYPLYSIAIFETRSRKSMSTKRLARLRSLHRTTPVPHDDRDTYSISNTGM